MKHHDTFRAVVFTMTLLMLSAYCSPLYSQTNTDLTTPETSDSSSEEEAFQEWAFIPIIASSTETGFMLGALAVRFLESDSPEAHTETIDMMAYGTVEEQFSASISPNLYFSDGKYHLNADIGGNIWPGNYYGIGNDTSSENPLEYESTSFAAECLFERQIIKHTYIGSSFTFLHEEFDSDDGIIWETSEITGREGGNQVGAGIVLSMDTRDNINDARTGTYIQYESKWFRESFGSDYDFTIQEFQANRYIALPKDRGIAISMQVRLSRGNIPFRELSSPDGTNILRGIENGRYRDRDMAAIQAEYRFPVKGRWGGTLFAETARVMRNISDMDTDGWKYGLGGGVRYALNQSERFNVRLDASWVDEGVGFVLNIREAF